MYTPSSEITCDCCGEGHVMDGTASEVRLILSESGWVKKVSRDYCSKCKTTINAKKNASIFDSSSVPILHRFSDVGLAIENADCPINLKHILDAVDALIASGITLSDGQLEYMSEVTNKKVKGWE
jgi:hypothetical protein